MSNNNSGRQSVHDVERFLGGLDGGGGGHNSLEFLTARNLHLEQEVTNLRAQIQHNKEHENARIELIDNSESAWCLAGNLKVTNFTVFGNKKGHCTIRSTKGFRTSLAHNPDDLLIYNVNYYELAINELKLSNDHELVLRFGLADEHFPIAYMSCHGNLKIFGQEAAFGCGFVENDIVGCGVVVTQKSKSAVDAKCEPCIQQPCKLFFTKNGELCGTPIPLTNMPVPPIIYPTVMLGPDDQVTANFGRKAFKFLPAKGLNACGHCCHCKQFA